MSTLKIVLHVEKTLKTITQKNLRKSQKFAMKLSMAEFRYSQTIFLRFTVTLAKSNEQRAKSNEKQEKSNEQKVTSNEQKVTSNEQKVTSNKQQAKGATSKT